jgi:hypothetical protein
VDVEGVMRETDLVLFSSEHFPLKARHLDELRALADCSRNYLAFLDGIMTG